MSLSILTNRGWTDSNGTFVANTIYTLDDSVARVYVNKGMASFSDALQSYGQTETAFAQYDVNGDVTGLVNQDGSVASLGGVNSVETLPSTGELGKIYQTPDGNLYNGYFLSKIPNEAKTPYNANTNLILRALADSKCGTAHRRIFVIGDSTSTGNSLGITKSWPTYLKTFMHSAGYNIADGFAASHNFSLNTGTWTLDPRCTFSTTTNISTLGSTIPSLRFNGAGNMTFTPEEQFTNIRFYFFNNEGGTISYQIDGGTATNIVVASGTNYTPFDVTGIPLGNHTITINWVSGIVDMIGVEVWDAGANKANIINIASNGQAQWILNFGIANSKLDNLLFKFKPDVLLYELGTNDFNITLAQFQTDLDYVIASCATRGVGLILGTFAPNNGWGNGDIALANSKRDIIRNTALANNIPIVDIDRRWGSSYATWNTLGAYVDAVHLSALGAAEKASAWKDALIGLPSYTGR